MSEQIYPENCDVDGLYIFATVKDNVSYFTNNNREQGLKSIGIAVSATPDRQVFARKKRVFP